MELSRVYKIETGRLTLRCYNPADAPMVHTAITASVEHLRPWLPWIQQEPKTVDARVSLLRHFRGQFDLGLDYVFGIFDKQEKEVIGSTGLHTRVGKNAREIGYWIGIDHIGNGYAQEAVCALTKIGFDYEGLSRIEIHCVPDNLRSKQIPSKLGYMLEAIIADPSRDMKEIMIWAMNREDYIKTTIKDTHLKAFDCRGQLIDPLPHI